MGKFKDIAIDLEEKLAGGYRVFQIAKIQNLDEKEKTFIEIKLPVPFLDGQNNIIKDTEKIAYANLKDFKDDYGTRRNKEASFLNPQTPVRRPDQPDQPVEAKEEGGPVNAGQPYLVGEDGPELIIPDQDGTVIPSANTQAKTAVAQILADAGVGSYAVPQQSLGLPGADLYIPRDRTPKRKVKYVAFDDPTTPRIAVPEEFTPEQVQDYMKSEEVEAQMYDQGYLYKFGNQPSSLKDASDQDDWALTAGIKSGS